jgi:hypothetical protein
MFHNCLPRFGISIASSLARELFIRLSLQQIVSVGNQFEDCLSKRF